MIACAVLASLLAPAGAWAYEEPNTLTGSGCVYCHPHAGYPAMDCESCHGDVDAGSGPVNGYEQGHFSGPHGGYTTGTTKCDNCHTAHVAPAALMLLPEPTIVATCFSCHDGTGGFGVYGVIEARTGIAASGGHSYNMDSIIPGGDGATGGDVTGTFGGPGGTLICTDCHSPHGSEVVEPFVGDRRRIRTEHASIRSTRLLRQKPSGATTPTTEYGADWCLGCHAGRSSGAMVLNHPVDSTMSTATPYTYDNVAVLDSDDPTSDTVIGTMGGLTITADSTHGWPATPDAAGNRGYLMPYPRTVEQQGHGPICQQCHEDARSVGELVGDGSVADALPTDVWDADGVYWGGTSWVEGWEYDNPPFQNFPHETMNPNMLVETYDNLCLNCHPVGQMP